MTDEFTPFNNEELEVKLIDNIERMATNVGGNIRQLIIDKQYTYAVRELGNLIKDATMALYVCERKVMEHGTYTPSAQRLEFGNGTVMVRCRACDDVFSYQTGDKAVCPKCGNEDVL